MYYLGIDIGGTSIKAGIVTENNKIIYKASTKTSIGPSGFINTLVTLVQKILDESGLNITEIASIGIGCPGYIDAKNGVIDEAGNLQLRNYPLVEKLKEHFNLPIYLHNDANCAALGEYWALNDKTIESYIMVTLGTGIGGGIILNGQIYAGCNGRAGEFGHMIVCIDGRQCACGYRGCWETYASVNALIKDAKAMADTHPDSLLHKLSEQVGGKIDGEIIFRAVEEGDYVAQTVFQNYIKYLGEGLISIVELFQPEVVTIGGGLSNAGDKLLEPLKAYIAENSRWLTSETRMEIRVAQLGNDAGIIGATHLGRN